MSATRDKSQKIAFVFSNLHQIYRRAKAASAAETAEIGASAPIPDPAAMPGLTTASRVLKTGDLADPTFAVRTHNPAEFIGKRIPRPPVLPPSAAVVSLRENLKTLTDLHSRLRFMLQELEDLVKE